MKSERVVELIFKARDAGEYLKNRIEDLELHQEALSTIGWEELTEEEREFVFSEFDYYLKQDSA